MARILHVIRSVNPAGGGPIEGLKQLANVNLRHGHEVEVLSLDRPSDPWLKDCSVKCHALGPSWLAYGYSPRLVKWLRDRRSDYDVVIVNGLWQYGSFGVWRSLRGTSTPYLVFTHGMLDPWFKRTYPLKHAKKWLYWPWAEYRVLRDAAAVLFTCEEERRLARESFWLYKCREIVVTYGTGGPEGDSNAQRDLFWRRFPHLVGKRCLLFLGRVHVKKGPDLLFRAFSDILNELPASRTDKVHIVMAGPNDHPYGREMANLSASLGLSDRVTWTGMLKGDLKWGAFHTAEAFILPSHQENFGIAVVEALACGVPVLISDQVNIWREINNDRVGYIEADDLAGTKALLRRWLDTSPDTWSEMRVRAREAFSKRYNISSAAEALIAVVHMVVRMNDKR